MSFWSLSTGTAATGEVTENNFDPLPKGDYQAILEAATVEEYEGVKSVKLKARTTTNRGVFLNLKCWDEDDKKRDRAINVLVKLFQITGAQMPAGEPDDMALSRLTNKPLSLKLDVWEFNDKSGNWLVNASAVGASVPAGNKPAASKPQGGGAPQRAAPQNPGDEDLDIPF